MSARNDQPNSEALWWALESTPVILFSVDAEGRFSSMDGGALKNAAISRESVLGQCLFDRPLIPAEVKSAVRRALAGESCELRTTVRDRQWVLRVSPLRDGSEAVVGASGIALDVSGQSSAERRLRESEARLRALVDALPIDIWARDAERTCILQNPAAVRRFGHILGMNIDETPVSDAVRRMWAERTDRAFSGEIVRVAQHRSEGGVERYFETIVAPIMLDGRVVGTVGANIDLTERERAKTELQRERDFTEAIVETAAALIVVLDAEARVVRFNRASETLTGVSRGEVLGKPFWELVAPADREHVRRAFTRNFPERFEARVQSTSEDGRLVAWTNKPLFRGEMLEYVICSGVDITERREEELSRARRLVEAQEARRRSEFLAEAGRVLAASLDYEETLSTVAELAVKAFADICVVDVLGDDGQPRRVAVACRDPARRPMAEALKRYAPDPSAPMGIPWVLRTGQPYVSRRVPEWVRSGGDADRAKVGIRDEVHQRLLRETPVHSLISVPLTSRRRTVGALTFLSSDPERPYGEADVLLATELGDRAALAVDNARLYREAKEAVAAREEFLSIASHELRTPLTSLQLCAQSLPRVASGPLSEAEQRYQKQALETIERQSRRIARLVDTLLDVTRAQAGRLQLVTEETDLVSVTREVVAHFAQDLESAGQKLEVDAPEQLVGEWDRPRLDQVLTNLVSNAVKYGQSRPISVTLREEGERAIVEVQDRGRGIPPDRQAKLFERFERVGEKRITGLGLGLYIVKCIVDAHGGRVSVESVPNEGTCVRVVLPRRVPSPWPASPGAPGEPRNP